MSKIINFTLKHETIERPAIFGEGDTLFRYDYAAKHAKNKKVLDIGTGYGDGAEYIKSKGAKSVTAIDFSESAILHAKKKFAKIGVTFLVMDAMNLQFPPNTFDVVVAFEILEHIPLSKQKSFLLGIKKVLKKNGVLILSTPNKLIYSPNTTKPHNPFHTKEFEPDELEMFLKKHFSKVEVMGLKIVNKQYLKQHDTMGKMFRYKIFSLIGKFKLVRNMAGYIPKNTRMKLTAEDKIPLLSIKDIKIHHKSNREIAETLMAFIHK